MPGTLRLRLAAVAACAFLSLGQKCYTDPSGEFEITASVTTTGPDQDPNGYQVGVESPAGNSMGPSSSLPSNGSISLGSWPVAVWQARLGDIAPNCQPAVNPIEVHPTSSSDAAFQVTCGANVGALNLSLTTQGTAYKNAFELAFDWQAALTVSPTATQHVSSVPVGQRTVTLGALPAHCSTGQPVRSIPVTFDVTVPVSWDVTCASNRALDVTLATTGGLPDPDGYTVTARFVVDGTPVMVNKVVAASGTVRVDELAHYPVELAVSGLATNCTVAGTNPRTVTPPATGVGTETFTVDCPAPQVFHPLTITIQAVAGAGVSVLANSVPMVCTALQCAATFLEGTLVNLALSPLPGSVVNSIVGDCVPGAGGLSATVLMNAPRNCTILVGLAPLLGLRFMAALNYSWNGEAMIAKRVPGASLRSGAASLRAASATLLVAARVPNPNSGAAPAIEYNLDDPTNLVEVSEGGLCGVRTMVYAVEPTIGPAIYGFSGDAPWSCLTQYPLGGLIGLFNFGTSAGEALTLPSDPSHILVGGYDGYLRRMQLGGNIDYYQLVTGQQTCPGDLAVRGTTLLVVGREGTAGTSTANCNNHRGLWRFDLLTNTVTGFVSLGGSPRDVVMNAAGTLAYVADYSGNAVHVVNVTTMTLVRSIPMSGGPTVVALTPGDTHLLVGLWDANELRMLDLGNDQVVDTESSRGVHPAGLVIIDQLALLMNFGDPTPFTGTGGSLAVFEFSTGVTASVRAGARSRR